MSCDSTHPQRHIMPLGVIFLNCCVTDLRNKQVINQRDGNILGPVSDIEVDTCSGKVVAINFTDTGKVSLICPKYCIIKPKRT